jgi:hypothetical protein
METVLLQPPNGGKPVEVEADPAVLTPLLVEGYTQVRQNTPAVAGEKVTQNESER